MNDATIRTWVANLDLRIGDRGAREAGNPRYDLSDCARVFALHILHKQLGLPGASAVWAVNKAWAQFCTIADIELAAIDNRRAAPDCPRYILRLPASAGEAELNPTIRLFNDPDEKADREASRGLCGEIVVELREIVRAARDNLVSELGGSISELRHDFADAPDA